MTGSSNWRTRINDVAAVATCSALLLSSGCSASGGGPYGAAAQGDIPGSTLSAECEGRLACDASGQGEAPGSVCVQTVDASLRAMDGSPLANRMVTTCGKDLCMKGTSDSDGNVHIVICQSMREPAFEVNGGSKYVTFAVPVTESISSIAPLTLTPFPAQGEDLSAAAQSGAPVASGGVVLSPAAGTSIEFDMEVAFDADAQRFRAAMVPPENVAPSVDPALGIELLVGLAPGKAELSSPARLSIPNVRGWPVGTTVRLYQHGIDPLGEGPAPFGRWTPAGTGRVADDGETIVTDEGCGLSYLGLVGVGRM